mmetsp:Transcript_18811/g.36913  ORF Transcript_18811/g.36913 Transcript_18811/m.36913 type:complete len:110 (-) Transcript_18811:237-566(-)
MLVMKYKTSSKALKALGNCIWIQCTLNFQVVERVDLLRLDVQLWSQQVTRRTQLVFGRRRCRLRAGLLSQHMRKSMRQIGQMSPSLHMAGLHQKRLLQKRTAHLRIRVR